jgi:hypothetical protein
MLAGVLVQLHQSSVRPRIGHDDVRRSAAIDSLGEQRLHLSGLGDVRPDGDRIATAATDSVNCWYNPLLF